MPSDVRQYQMDQVSEIAPHTWLDEAPSFAETVAAVGKLWVKHRNLTA